MVDPEKLPIGNNSDLPTVIRQSEELGHLIQRTRKRQKLTQRDVAGLAGSGNRFLVELERGKPTVQLQKALDVLALLGLEVVIRKKGNRGEL